MFISLYTILAIIFIVPWLFTSALTKQVEYKLAFNMLVAFILVYICIHSVGEVVQWVW